MSRRFNGARAVVALFWICSLVAVAVCAWQLWPHTGWDVRIYHAAMVSLRVGHDPYADAVAIQRMFYAQPAHPPGTLLPYCYVYSPITLPLLRVIAAVPLWLSAAAYWTIFALAVLVTLRVAWWMCEGEEGRVFAYLLPAAIFFPGLLENENLFSGNVAYILYGCVFAAALLGWKRRQWLPFYAVVLIASCVKAPMLSLLAIAVLSERRQWLAAGVSGVAGVALFVVQPRLWPSLFHNYLTAVELQFTFNRDFSSSPAGLLADALFKDVPYQITSAVSYLLYACVVAVVLLMLRRKFLAGEFTLRRWVPVMLVGTILLNPRIMEYDVAPLAIPMALVIWRVFGRVAKTQRGSVVMTAVFFAGVNICGAFEWKPTECCLLVGVFAAGVWDLYTRATAGEPRAARGREVTPLAAQL